jgi:hypothetical protein
MSHGTTLLKAAIAKQKATTGQMTMDARAWEDGIVFAAPPIPVAAIVASEAERL